eukprot:g9704.t1
MSSSSANVSNAAMIASAANENAAAIPSAGNTTVADAANLLGLTDMEVIEAYAQSRVLTKSQAMSYIMEKYTIETARLMAIPSTTWANACSIVKTNCAAEDVSTSWARRWKTDPGSPPTVIGVRQGNNIAILSGNHTIQAAKEYCRSHGRDKFLALRITVHENDYPSVSSSELLDCETGRFLCRSLLLSRGYSSRETELILMREYMIVYMRSEWLWRVRVAFARFMKFVMKTVPPLFAVMVIFIRKVMVVMSCGTFCMVVAF